MRKSALGSASLTDRRSDWRERNQLRLRHPAPLHQPSASCYTVADQADSNGVSGLQLAPRHGRWRRPFCWRLKQQMRSLQMVNGSLNSKGKKTWWLSLSPASSPPDETWTIPGKSPTLHLCFDQLRSIVCVSERFLGQLGPPCYRLGK